MLDVRLPDGDGIEVCREIRSTHPEVACLMLTSFADDEAVFARSWPARPGYVLKQVRGTDLVDGGPPGGSRRVAPRSLRRPTESSSGSASHPSRTSSPVSRTKNGGSSTSSPRG